MSKRKSKKSKTKEVVNKEMITKIEQQENIEVKLSNEANDQEKTTEKMVNMSKKTSRGKHDTNNEKNKKVDLKKKVTIIVIMLMVICFGLLVYSIVNIVKWKTECGATQKQLDDIQEVADVIEVEDNENVEILDSQDNQENPYWKFIKTKLINVDFSELKETNNQTKGWIQVNGSTVNYPFVQTNNNEFYLNHSFDKSYNSAGWVFADYRNNMDNFDKNTILYAHNRKDNTMFGSLQSVLTNGWLDNPDNFIIRLSTEKENTLWQVFSVYQIPTTSDYLRTTFATDEEFKDFANALIARSAYNFNTTVSGSDKMITLSTCFNKTDKVVIHAKLIKKETR